MGLVFALQPDLRQSTPSDLVIRSSKKKFGLGGSFVFGGALLGTMFLAASPLFKIFWTQGNLFDRLVTIAVLTPICLYPVLALACWFYEERFEIHRAGPNEFSVTALERVMGLKWNRRQAAHVTLDDFVVENWTGNRNVAALAAAKKGKADRYGTRGHWMLKLRVPQGLVLLERRAKKDEIELLKAQIEAYFKV